MVSSISLHRWMRVGLTVTNLLVPVIYVVVLVAAYLK